MKLFFPALIIGATLLMSCKKDKETTKDEEEKEQSTKPVVSIASLESTTYYILDVDTNITITANASDPNGSISKVRFYINDELEEEITSPPYSIQKNFSYNESYKISAVAYDNDGDSSTATVDVEFKPKQIHPVISITYPGFSSLGVYGADTSLTFQAEASDINGSITSVKFYVDGTLLNEDNDAPYQASFHTYTKGQSYELSAVATDNDNFTNTATKYLDITEPQFVSTGSFTVDGNTYDPQNFTCSRVGDVFIINMSLDGGGYPNVALKITTTGTTGNIHCDSTSTATYGIVNTASGNENYHNSYWSGYGDFNITLLTTDRIQGTFSFSAKNAARTSGKSVTGSFYVGYE